MKDFKQWDGFAGRLWKEGVDVRDFIPELTTHHMTEMILSWRDHRGK